MQINPHVPFISETDLEESANALLDRYAWEFESITAPPVPVEKIADFLLELAIEWLDIPDTEAQPILAYLQPDSNTIRLNERHLPFFDQYPGTYEYTLAHEIGHHQLHLTEHEVQPESVYVCRARHTGSDRREWQAERFAGYLLMPISLLLPAIEGVNLQHWPSLYRLRNQFKVSITALKIRLEELGFLYIAPNDQLYPTRQQAGSDLRQALRHLVSQGQLYRMLGRVEQAEAAYLEALNIAQELRDRRNEAFLAWQLGLLCLETDPARAVILMSVCVAYEREIGHPQAEIDAARIARIERTT